MYFAVIGDIIDSRSILNRNEVQQNLMNKLQEVNILYGDSIASNFTVTLGDEFQGLLHRADKIFEIIDYVRYSLYPLRFRFGVGIGNMSTDFKRETSIGSDGPAYWAARQAIDTVRKDGSKLPLIRIDFDDRQGLGEKISSAQGHIISTVISVVNSALDICGQQERFWTNQQTEFVAQLISRYRYRRYAQVQIAHEFSMSQQLVSSKMLATGIKRYVNARINLQRNLQEVCAGADDVTERVTEK